MSTSYLKTLNESLDTSKEMLRLLEFRVNHLQQKNNNTVGISLYEINENKITIIKTNAEIHTLKKIIKEKENYFEKFAKQFDADKLDMEANYNRVLAQAKNSQKPNLKQFLSNVNFEMINSNIEHKVDFYKKLQQHLK